MKTAFKITYKLSPTARKKYTAVQFWDSAEAAKERGQRFIRRNGYSEAIVLSAEPTNDPR